jgi:hypothetical protein
MLFKHLDNIFKQRLLALINKKSFRLWNTLQRLLIFQHSTKLWHEKPIEIKLIFKKINKLLLSYFQITLQVNIRNFNFTGTLISIKTKSKSFVYMIS